MSNKKLTTEEFIIRAEKVHNKYYTYSKVVYINTDTKVCIVCPKHGEFMQTPYQHIIKSAGCPKCGNLRASEAKRSSLDSFIQKATLKHNGKYTYDNAVYTAAKDKITITCPDHGDFEQLVSGHLSGYGCKLCANYGKGRVDMKIPTTLYYLFLKDVDLYKVGITSKLITERYRTSFDRDQFEVIYTKEFNTGAEAYAAEQAIHKEFSKFKYKGAKVLKTGNTELYTKDILNKNKLDGRTSNV